MSWATGTSNVYFNVDNFETIYINFDGVNYNVNATWGNGSNTYTLKQFSVQADAITYIETLVTLAP